jgi:hypothetical protein
MGKKIDVGILMWEGKSGAWQPQLGVVCNIVELMAKYTATRLTGLVEMIRGLANPKSEGARREVHSHPQPCLKFEVRQGRRGSKDCDVQTGIIQFDVVR